MCASSYPINSTKASNPETAAGISSVSCRRSAQSSLANPKINSPRNSNRWGWNFKVAGDHPGDWLHLRTGHQLDLRDLLVKRLNLALELDRQRVSLAIDLVAHRHLDPAFADAVFNDIRTLLFI
jgi:hypothetical protein